MITYASRRWEREWYSDTDAWTTHKVDADQWLKIIEKSSLVVPKATLACAKNNEIRSHGLEDPDSTPVVIIDYIDDARYNAIYDPIEETMKQADRASMPWHNSRIFQINDFEPVSDPLLYSILRTIATDYLATL